MTKTVFQYALLLMGSTILTSCAHHETPYGQPGADVQKEEKFLYGRPGVFVYFIHLPSSELRGMLTDEQSKKRVQYIKEQFRRNPSLVPPECLGEIELLEWGDTESGNAIASFRCIP